MPPERPRFSRSHTFSPLDQRPQRTIVFALFGSEEIGGYGNRAFLQHPPVPLTSIVANLEFEMIGRPDPAVPAGTLWLTGFDRSNLGPELAKHGAHLVNDPHPKEQFFQRSDNYALANQGIIAHTVSSFGLHKDYHQPSDELRTIDFSHMTNAIASMVGPDPLAGRLKVEAGVESWPQARTGVTSRGADQSRPQVQIEKRGLLSRAFLSATEQLRCRGWRGLLGVQHDSDCVDH